MISTFPGGSPGLGLLILRAAIGSIATLYGAVNIVTGGFGASFAGSVAIASGVLLTIGILTPFVGALVGFGALGVALAWFPLAAVGFFETKTVAILMLPVAIAIVLLGPGAMSVDARLFGRREIIIPPGPRPPEF